MNTTLMGNPWVGLKDKINSIYFTQFKFKFEYRKYLKRFFSKNYLRTELIPVWSEDS
jgi:hypothetical protein